VIVLRPPFSKSDAHRALVLACATGREAELPSLEGAPDDVRILQTGLEALSQPGALIDCRDGGAPLRFLVAQAAVTPGARVRFTGSPRLGARPHLALFQALRDALGQDVVREGSPFPIEVHGPRVKDAPRFEIDPRASSQFPSALLLAAAKAAFLERRPWTVELTSTSPSEGYLQMTVAWLQRFGFTVQQRGQAFTLQPGTSPSTLPPIPADWSSLAYLLLIAWACKGRVEGMDLRAVHPDRAIVGILEAVGLYVDPTGVVEGEPQTGLTASGLQCPDLLPTLAALACVLPHSSSLTDLAVLRGKESDRVEGIIDLVTAAGGRAVLHGDTLTLHPPKQVLPLRIASLGDHRRAMSAAVLAVLAQVPLELDDAACVAKSFPGFWAELGRAGVDPRLA
jgi:3-phosphoshikimate 1-carboxyvinyltransferase